MEPNFAGKGNKYFEQIQVLQDTKEKIFEQVRKKREENQRIFEGICNLDGTFEDIGKMIDGLEMGEDAEAVRNLKKEFERLWEISVEFEKNLEKEKNNENERWGEMTRLEDKINQLMKNIVNKTNELEELEDRLDSQKFYFEEMNGKVSSDHKEHLKLIEAVSQKEKRKHELENLYMAETHELERLKAEIDGLVRKKQEKELEVKILQEKEEKEKKSYDEVREQFEALRKISNKVQLKSLVEDFSIKKKSGFQSPHIKSLQKGPEIDTNSDQQYLQNVIFMIAVVFLVMFIAWL